ncbi:MAG: 4Fe-4S binding protein [Anaerolineae bacterium]|jgi:NADH-quinone oxidoreductase subunit I|nr:4Fe-4S binding protein [Anaerolineae bacterium]
MYGRGILKGLGVTIKHFIDTYIDDLRYGLNKYSKFEDNFTQRQSHEARGAFTIQYPDEKMAMPERFRFTPFLVVNDDDHPDAPGQDWCTSCGICAKVCPPQCIWIVRGQDPVTKRPIPEPEAFYIDIDICMNCGFCAEFCPFDAIKMDHDYEMASYDRTTTHIHDKNRLQKPFTYWRSIAPQITVEEAEARGGWEHVDVIKAKEKAAKEAAKKAAAAEPAKPATADVIPTGEQAAQGESLKTDTVDSAANVAALNRAEASTPDTPASDPDAEKAARLAKREAALARKHAKKEGGES